MDYQRLPTRQTGNRVIYTPEGERGTISIIQYSRGFARLSPIKRGIPMTYRSILLFGISVALIAAMAVGCQKVPKPSDDKTPPVLRWTAIKAGTNNQLKFNGGGTISANVGDYFTVILVAEDPEGIHQVKLGGSTGWTCRNGDVAQSMGPSLGAEMVQNLQPDAQGKVLTSIFLIQNANMTFQCQSGFHFSGGSTVFNGSGTNYGGQTVSGTLTIKVAG